MLGSRKLQHSNHVQRRSTVVTMRIEIITCLVGGGENQRSNHKRSLDGAVLRKLNSRFALEHRTHKTLYRYCHDRPVAKQFGTIISRVLSAVNEADRKDSEDVFSTVTYRKERLSKLCG